MHDPPRVSVVIPCYNHARFLPEAVLSVIAQSFGDWEIIIVDDGSTDGSDLVAERLITTYRDHSIRLMRQENRGPGRSRNNGIRQARGAYILTLDADDLVAPEMLAHTVAVLDASPRVGFVYTDVQRFGAESNTLHTSAFSRDWLRFDAMMMPETLFRRVAWEEVGGFYEVREFHYEDWDFWLSLAAAGWEGHHIAAPLVLYRRSAAGSRLTGGQRHDLELRAELFVRHRALYPAPVIAWAERVISPAWSRDRYMHSSWRWMLAFVQYLALLVRYEPRLLPRSVLRPIFWRMPIWMQGMVRPQS